MPLRPEVDRDESAADLEDAVSIDSMLDDNPWPCEILPRYHAASERGKDFGHKAGLGPLPILPRPIREQRE